MLNSVYCRRLEDSSGFGVFRRIVTWSSFLSKPLIDANWELCLCLGSTKNAAWENYQALKEAK